MKSLFEYTKQQRIGIFLLVLVILLLQIWLYVLKSKPDSAYQTVDEEVYKKFQKEIDSLQCVEEEKAHFKIHPFNPNFITDYKGYVLGMSTEEIDRLLTYRSQNKWINSAKQFQEVTKVSDSLLKTMSPYFKFPKKFKKRSEPYKNASISSEVTKTDLNKATVQQLDAVYGVGNVLAKRILKYRDKHDGFASLVELQEIYGLKPEVIERIASKFEVQTPRAITTVNVNTATSDELVTIKYIDYELAYHIVEYRTLRKGIKAIEELKEIEDFPVEKYDIIKLYLQLN